MKFNIIQYKDSELLIKLPDFMNNIFVDDLLTIPRLIFREQEYTGIKFRPKNLLFILHF
jgi:hypothetical protein